MPYGDLGDAVLLPAPLVPLVPQCMPALIAGGKSPEYRSSLMQCPKACQR